MTIRTVRKLFLGLVVVGGFCVVGYAFTHLLVLLIGAVVLLSAATLLSNLFDRCPHCNTYQNFPFHRGNRCPKCDQEYDLDTKYGIH